MSKITSPKIDERSVKTLLQQIRAKVPFYTREWNPGQEGEAGLALARIYLQMLEQVLFRLNQVPHQKFVAFLDMLGIDMLPAQSAQAIVTFKLVEGTLEHVRMPAGTQLAGEGAIDQQEVIFETQTDLRVTPAVLKEVFSFDAPNDKIYLHTEAFAAPEPFVLFDGVNRQERSLYIGHADLFALANPTDVTIHFVLSRGATGGALTIVWEYWNGDRWVLLHTFEPAESSPSGLKTADVVDSTELFTRSGEMKFGKTSRDEIKILEHYGQESRWLRCRLQNQLSSRQPVQLPSISTLRLSISPADPFPAELAFNNDVPLNLEKITLMMQAISGFVLDFPEKRDTELSYVDMETTNVILLDISGKKPLEANLVANVDYLVFDNRSDPVEIRRVVNIDALVLRTRVTLDSALDKEYDLNSKVSVFGQPPGEIELRYIEMETKKVILLDISGKKPLEANLKANVDLVFDNGSDATETRKIVSIDALLLRIKVTLDSVLGKEYDLDSKITVIDQPPRKKDKVIFIKAAVPTGDSLQVNDFLKLDNTFETAEIRSIAAPPESFSITSGNYLKIELDERLQCDYDNPQATIEFVTALRANGITLPVESFAGLEITAGSKTVLFHGNSPESLILETDPANDTALTLPSRTGDVYIGGDLVNIIPQIKPFGEQPVVFDTFYIASDEAFSKKRAIIIIEVDSRWNGINYPENGDPAQPTEIDPVLSWEYWNGRGWRGLRVTDETSRFFKRPHYDADSDKLILPKIRFTCPNDIEKVEINGEEKYWIRVRIIDGDYGKEIIVQPTNGPFPLVKQGSVHYPIIYDLTVNYRDQPRPPQKCFTLNNLDFVDRLAEVIDPDRSFAPFEIIREDFASLYLGFDKKLEGGPISILFDVDEQFLPEEDRVKMAWFYWNGNAWIQLNVEDRTEHLTKKDLLKFAVPNDFSPLELFDKKLFWIKGSVIESAHPKPVKILRISPNSTDAIQASIANDEVLGSSDGTANQEFKLLNRLIITQEVRVTEPNRPAEEEEQVIIQEEGKEKAPIVELKDATGEVAGYVVRWHAVDDFDKSGPLSRHYAVDKRLGIIKFGDGDKGLVPPFGTDNIVADYKFGGGKNGNVGVGKISTLKNAIPFVSEVTNHLAADGGSETETLDEVLVRGPLQLKNRERAVSAEDFESLARNASRKIVRAKCLPNTDESGEHAPGQVTVLVVPDSQQAGEEPTRLLIKVVEGYLLEHSANLVSAPDRIHVAGAKYVKIIVEPTLVPVNLDAAARVESEALTRLKRFIHPITGGPDQSGWEFGKKICRAEIFALLEGIPEVDHVKELKISANGVKQADDVILDSFSVPFSGEHRININLNGQQTGGQQGRQASECAEERFFKECPV